ncbi:hypothetical protein M409DRAFT_21952 [Zasmidium cellare ATCC 36951]|uniref:Uncharacterized protein n=1 Tax=Zasmidium cellare ATCC 36951 TaxID=1080233 RepID=A0A6A6CKS4_ZASCE|nr:uncharacterized protein M409DRAFT_21952 [Zasmidium cellare ATCC 36951]KAF2167804.1 hypothetical protein M409DRAFT_21952 [Zasmidium cellare ATCC 36951]
MSATVLPAYSPETSTPQTVTDEKTTSTCTIHTPSPTPQLDAQLHSPKYREYLLTISEALADLADAEEPHCTKCSIDTVALTLTELLKDVKAEKKNGAWSKEQAKVLKKEGKLLGKAVKADCERVWREGKEKKERRGWW